MNIIIICGSILQQEHIQLTFCAQNVFKYVFVFAVPKDEKMTGYDQSDMIMNGGDSKRNDIVFNIDMAPMPMMGQSAVRLVLFCTLSLLMPYRYYSMQYIILTSDCKPIRFIYIRNSKFIYI